MALVKCPECGHEISDQAKACPHCAYPIAEHPVPVQKAAEKGDSIGETILEVDHPSMFRNHPFWDSLCVLVIVAGPVLVSYFGWPYLAVSVVGIVALFAWWLICQATQLTVTDERTILRKGLLSKQTNEVRHEDVRNIQVSQSFLQRMLSVGRVSISSAGQDTIEITIDGVRDPQAIANLIRTRQ